MEISIVGSAEPLVTKPGGTRSYIMNLIEYLCSKDEKVTLYGIFHNSNREPNRKGFKFKAVAKGKKISSVRYLFNLFLKTPFYRMSKDVIIHAQRPDILFPFALFKRKNPKIVTMHGIPGRGIHRRKSGVTWRIYNYLEKFSLKRADKVITVDSRTEKWYLKRYEWLKGKSCVIPVGVDLSRFKPLDKNIVKEKFGFDSKDKIILYIGRLEREKRIDLLIESFKKLNSETNVKLVIVGDGPERGRLVAQAETPNILFLGTLPHERIPEILNCAEVLVLSSEYEGMPTVVLEAMACGIPVVSTNVGDVNALVIDGKTGYLAKANAEDLKEKISIVVNNSEKFKYNCIEISKRYSWDIVAENVMNVYREVSNEVA